MWGWLVGSDSLVNTYLQYWSWRCACNVMQGMGDFINEMVDIMCQDECNVKSLSFVLYLTLCFNSIHVIWLGLTTGKWGGELWRVAGAVWGTVSEWYRSIWFHLSDCEPFFLFIIFICLLWRELRCFQQAKFLWNVLRKGQKWFWIWCSLWGILLWG